MIKKRILLGVIVVLLFVFLVMLFNYGITGKFVYESDDFNGVYVDFGLEYKNKSLKSGAGVVGKEGEFWNTVYVPESKFTYYQLRYANGDQSNIGIQLVNLDSFAKMSYKAAINDEMFNIYNYASETEAKVRISNLKNGDYDVYIYGNNGKDRGNYTLSVVNKTKSISYGNKAVKEGDEVYGYREWVEDIQYVKFSGIILNDGDMIEINLKEFSDADSKNIAFIQGLQIVRSNTKRVITPIELPSTTLESNSETCVDDEDGINIYVTGNVYDKINDLNRSDVCFNPQQLEEIYCINGSIGSQIIDCDNGCFEGKCFSLQNTYKDEGNSRVFVAGVICRISGLFDGQNYNDCLYETFN